MGSIRGGFPLAGLGSIQAHHALGIPGNWINLGPGDLASIGELPQELLDQLACGLIWGHFHGIDEVASIAGISLDRIAEAKNRQASYDIFCQIECSNSFGLGGRTLSRPDGIAIHQNPSPGEHIALVAGWNLGDKWLAPLRISINQFRINRIGYEINPDTVRQLI